MLLSALTLFLCGCEPEETFVVVNASALKEAAAGKLAYAKVEMVFDINDKEDPQLPTKIRKAALPFLGRGAVIEVEKTEKRHVRESASIREESEREVDRRLENAKLVARFNIPIGTIGMLEDTRQSILWLKYKGSDKTFQLVHGNAIGSLNSSLRDVNDSIEFEYNGGYGGYRGNKGTTIKIVDDESITIGAAAVKTNGQHIISGTCSTQDGPLKISYNNNFYNGLAPCFVFGSYPSLNTTKLKERIKTPWLDD